MFVYFLRVLLMQNATIATTHQKRAGLALENYCIIEKAYIYILNTYFYYSFT